jgi:hypothetical protein
MNRGPVAVSRFVAPPPVAFTTPTAIYMLAATTADIEARKKSEAKLNAGQLPDRATDYL